MSTRLFLGDGEEVFFLPDEGGGGGVFDFEHGGAEFVGEELEADVVEDREVGVGVEVGGGAFDVVGVGTAAAGDEVGDAVDGGALVVVDVAGGDDDGGVKGGRHLGEEVAEGDLVGAGIVVDLDVGLDVGDGGMVQSDDDEIDGGRKSGELAAEPVDLRAGRGEIAETVELDEGETVAEEDRVPAAAFEFREGGPPVLDSLFGSAGEFVVAEGGVDAEVFSSPGGGFGAVDVVVGGVGAAVGDVAGHLDGVGMLFGDLFDESETHPRVSDVRIPGVVGVVESLVAVVDDDGVRGERGGRHGEGGRGVFLRCGLGEGGGGEEQGQSKAEEARRGSHEDEF
jgi:hypothetical protein